MLKDLNPTPESTKMIRFETGDLKRLRNKLNNPETLTVKEIEELKELTETHQVLINRFTSLSASHKARGEQLNALSAKCHEYKKSNKTLSKKQQQSNLQTLEETPCCAKAPQLSLV